jgi:hypothetical protein
VDQYSNIAVVSIFFDLGDDSSEFLERLGFDPDGSPVIADELKALGTNEELDIDYTVVDLKTVSLIRLCLPFTVVDWRPR